MTTAETSVPTSPAFKELMATLDRTNDPGERQTALLRFYGCNAQTHADCFVNDLLASRNLRPGGDLSARGQAAVDAMLAICLRHNEALGLGFPEFAAGTRKLVEVAFFTRLNQLLALAIQQPQGVAWARRPDQIAGFSGNKGRKLNQINGTR